MSRLASSICSLRARATAASGVLLVTLVISATPLHSQSEGSLDLTVQDVGLSIGDSRRNIGIRLNYRDRVLEEAIGVNATIWFPYEPPRGTVQGIALGLPATGARRIEGLGVAVGLSAQESIRGITASLIGTGAGEDLSGITLAGLGIGAGNDIAGIAAGGLGLGVGSDLRGIGAGGLGAGVGGNVKGVAVGGLGAGIGGEITGLAAGVGGAAVGGDGTGFVIGGLGSGVGGRAKGVVEGDWVQA